MENPESPLKPRGPAERAPEWIAEAVGTAAGAWLGLVCIPLILTTFLAWLIARRFVKPSAQQFVPALAVQGGQLFSLLVGLAIVFYSPAVLRAIPVNYTLALRILDAMLQTTFIFWIALRPSIIAAGAVALYQSLGLLFDFRIIAQIGISTDYGKGLAASSFLNVLIIVFVFLGWFRTKKLANADSSSQPRPAFIG